MLSEEQRKTFEEGVKSGLPLSVIAQRAGVSIQNVQQRIKYYHWTKVYTKAKELKIVDILKQHDSKPLGTLRTVILMNGYRPPKDLGAFCNKHGIQYIDGRPLITPNSLKAVCFLLRTRLTTKEISERSGVSLKVLGPYIQKLRQLGFEPTAQFRYNATAIGTYPKSKDDVL